VLGIGEPGIGEPDTAVAGTGEPDTAVAGTGEPATGEPATASQKPTLAVR
jgi:hypothetical protein